MKHTTTRPDTATLTATAVHFGGPNYSHGAFVRVYSCPAGDFHIYDVAADYANNGNMYDGGYGPDDSGYVDSAPDLAQARDIARAYYEQTYE